MPPKRPRSKAAHAPATAPLPTLEDRAFGVLLHVTSLPGKHGMGDLGPEAHRWARRLQSCGARWWQTLPIHPVDRYHSPYAAASAFAGFDGLISPDLLVRDGLLKPAEARPGKRLPDRRVDYDAALAHRRALLALAYERFDADDAFDAFCDREAHWLDDWTLYAALEEAHRGKPWRKWPRPLRLRQAKPLAQAHEGLAHRRRYHAFVQHLFHRQWAELRAVCAACGVALMGDVPIFVGLDSCDVWSHRELFDLDREGAPKVISGVPPDDFSATGQLWEHPHYRWPAHQKTGYDWWVRRMRRTLDLYDSARVDHFLGFLRCWAIPYGDKTAKRGKWRKTPGRELLEALHEGLGAMPFVVEDLGLLTPEAAALRDDFGLPGMRILQFAFGGDDSYHAPHRWTTHCLAYTGTHDNDTLRGWLATLAPDQRRRALRYTGGPVT
ncbi:MAG: 4-alpha-glucanotransferase, partial [Planctomycetota bacterium]